MNRCLPHGNVELFSVLNPLIFGRETRKYLDKELYRLMSMEKDPKGYYVQAAKGIFNGYLRASEGGTKKGKIRRLS